jgi:hypothetical protein
VRNRRDFAGSAGKLPLLAKVTRRKCRKLIKGDPTYLVYVKAGTWREPEKLK